jgi:uncharacterized protein
MRLFLDTSTLCKLYHNEVGTSDLEAIFSNHQITHIFLAEITKIEFTSTFWKKVRTREITEVAAKVTIELFESDFAKYTFVATNTPVIELARILTSKYGTEGLRTLDSLQLSTAITLSKDADVFLTADMQLKSFMQKEQLPTEI